jgi:rhodanese-related sulfurtransferase
VYVHCDNGTRAVEAAKFLEKKGFADVRVIDVGVFELCRDGHFVKERG